MELAHIEKNWFRNLSRSQHQKSLLTPILTSVSCQLYRTRKNYYWLFCHCRGPSCQITRRQASSRSCCHEASCSRRMPGGYIPISEEAPLLGIPSNNSSLTSPNEYHSSDCACSFTTCRCNSCILSTEWVRIRANSFDYGFGLWRRRRTISSDNSWYRQKILSSNY